jgi:hypothetical protein
MDTLLGRRGPWCVSYVLSMTTTLTTTTNGASFPDPLPTLEHLYFSFLRTKVLYTCGYHDPI